MDAWNGIRFQGKHVLRDVHVVQREREQGGWVQVVYSVFESFEDNAA